MKKLLILSFLFISIQTFAQDALKMGNKIIGGGLSFSMSDSENDQPYWYSFNREDLQESTSFSFSPYYGRFYDDFTMVGLRLNVGSSDYEGEQLGDESIDNWNRQAGSLRVGGFLRKYFPANDKFGFFIESGIDLSRGTSNTESRYLRLQDSTFTAIRHETVKTISYSASIDAEGGMYFFFVPRFSIETNFLQFILSYSDSNSEYENLIDNQIEEGDGNSANVRFNLINSFSFDKIFTLNYYF